MNRCRSDRISGTNVDTMPRKNKKKSKESYGGKNEEVEGGIKEGYECGNTNVIGNRGM